MSAQEFINIISDLRREFLSEDFKDIISRPEEKRINLQSKLAQVVIGVRRCGKSTMCRKVLREAKVEAAYINFDDERLINVGSEDLNKLLEAIYFVYGDVKYLLLDEIQNVDGWPLFVNRLLRQGLHLLITGSNANLLSNELITHLTGRHHKIELFPFSFKEFAEFKEVDLNDFSTKGIANSKRYLNEYLQMGGFPELLSENDRRDYVDALFNAIIRRDVTKRYKIRQPETLYKLANLAVDNFGQVMNIKKLGEEFNISTNTVATYLNYLTEAFLIMQIKRFSFKSVERLRQGKYYVIDNAFLSERNQSFSTDNSGWRLENAVYIELLRRAQAQNYDVFFHRDRTFEIDFIRTRSGHIEELLQVCYDIASPKTRQREIKALKHGYNKFKCSNLTLITMHQEETIEINDGLMIKVVPAYKWFNIHI